MPLRRSSRAVFPLISAALLAGSLACGKDGPTGTKTPGPPAAMQVMSGNEQTGRVGEELPAALVVKVVDAVGTPVVGQSVSFVVTSGGGHVFAGTANTDANGMAQERWTLGTVAAQAQSLEARAVSSTTGEKLVFARFTATATPGPAASTVRVLGDAQTGAAGTTLAGDLTLRVRDGYGNSVPDATVTWTTTGGGTLSPTTSTSGADGLATTRWTLGTTPGTQLAFGRVGSLATTSFSATATVGAAARLELVRGDNQSAPRFGALPVALAVRALDAVGNPVSGATVTWTVVSGGGTVSPATSTAGTDGVAEARWAVGPTEGANSLRASLPNVTPVTFSATALPSSTSGARTWTAEQVLDGYVTNGGTYVWASSPTDVWAAGYGSPGGRIRRNNGTGWSTSLEYGAGQFVTLWGSGPTDIYATYKQNVFHYNGSSWQVTATVGDLNTWISRIWGGGPGDLWLTSDCGTTAVQLCTWQLTHITTSSTTKLGEASLFYTAIAGSGPNDVYVRTFDRTTSASAPNGYLTHFTDGGATRTRITVPAAMGNAMWAAGPNDLFLSGTGGSMVRYDGSTFTTMTTPATTAIRAIWGSGPTNVYAVGDGGTIIHFDGTSWSLEMSGTTENLTSVWGSTPDAPVYVGVAGGKVLTGTR